MYVKGPIFLFAQRVSGFFFAEILAYARSSAVLWSDSVGDSVGRDIQLLEFITQEDPLYLTLHL